MTTYREVAQRLAGDVEATCYYILNASWRRVGNELCCGSVSGEPGDSLKVHLTGDKAGVWRDFASGERGGDLLDLWAGMRGIPLPEAFKQACDFMNLRPMERRFEQRSRRSYSSPELNRIGFPSVLDESGKRVRNYLVQARKLSENTLNAYQVAANIERSEVVFPYLDPEGKVFQVKYLGLERPDGKKRIRTESDCRPGLFGWQAVTPEARQVAICEGEIDAMTVYEYGLWHRGVRLPALSVPFGAGTGHKLEWIEHEFERLARFDTLFLVFDRETDSTKQRLVEDTLEALVNRLGRHRCRVVILPSGVKDPNEALQKGVNGDDFRACFERARFRDPQALVSVLDYLEQTWQDFEQERQPPEARTDGIVLPWVDSRQKERPVFCPGEVTLVSGITGHGKSTWLSHMIVRMAADKQVSTCLASFEMPCPKTLKTMVRQGVARRFPDPAEFERAMYRLNDQLVMVRALGTMRLADLIPLFEYAYMRWGCTHHVLDSLTCLSDVSEEDWQAQKDAIQKLVDCARKLNGHIWIVCHPRDMGTEGNAPGIFDVAGSKKIPALAHNILVVHRMDPDKLQPGEPDVRLKVVKNRENGIKGTWRLWFDPDSRQYLSDGERPRVYI